MRIVALALLAATLLGVSGLSSCATASDEADGAVYPAKFASPPSNALREMIRLYVFDTLGTDYMADIEALSRSDKMIARDRGRAVASGRPIIAPDVEFRLEIVRQADGAVCRLVPLINQPEAPVLILPPDANCERLSLVL